MSRNGRANNDLAGRCDPTFATFGVQFCRPLRGKNQPRGNAQGGTHNRQKQSLSTGAVARCRRRACRGDAGGAQAQTNAPFINLTKPTAEQMALAARGSTPDRCSTLASQCRLRNDRRADGVLQAPGFWTRSTKRSTRSNRRPMRVADKSMAGKPDGALWSEQGRRSQSAQSGPPCS